MKVIFLTLAKMELNDAAFYYELEQKGLGNKFKEEIKKSVLRIVRFPKSWSLVKREIRKYLSHKFPYKILYSIEQDCILIIAVAHQHRKPDYWIDRPIHQN